MIFYSDRLDFEQESACEGCEKPPTFHGACEYCPKNTERSFRKTCEDLNYKGPIDDLYLFCCRVFNQETQLEVFGKTRVPMKERERETLLIIKSERSRLLRQKDFHRQQRAKHG